MLAIVGGGRVSADDQHHQSHSSAGPTFGVRAILLTHDENSTTGTEIDGRMGSSGGSSQHSTGQQDSPDMSIDIHARHVRGRIFAKAGACEFEVYGGGTLELHAQGDPGPNADAAAGISTGGVGGMDAICRLGGDHLLLLAGPVGEAIGGGTAYGPTLATTAGGRAVLATTRRREGDGQAYVSAEALRTLFGVENGGHTSQLDISINLTLSKNYYLGGGIQEAAVDQDAGHTIHFARGNLLVGGAF